MALNTIHTVAAAVSVSERGARRITGAVLRNLRHGEPAATYTDQVRGGAELDREQTIADRELATAWGWA